MLVQTVLYLTSVVSAIALIALILVQDQATADADPIGRGAEGPLLGLRRATVWSAGLFLTSALLIALADVRTTGSLLDGVDPPRGAAIAAAEGAPFEGGLEVAIESGR